MQQVEQAAEAAVARGCGFASLGIACALLGFAHEPLMLIRAAALMVTGFAAVLYWMSGRARAHPYKKTHAWLMLDPAHRPPPEIAQRTLGTALEDVYRRFTRLAFLLALVLWGLVVLAQVGARVVG